MLPPTKIKTRDSHILRGPSLYPELSSAGKLIGTLLGAPVGALEGPGDGTRAGLSDG